MRVVRWVVGGFDALFLGFGLLMIVSTRARNGFADWVDRRMERRGR